MPGENNKLLFIEASAGDVEIFESFVVQLFETDISIAGFIANDVLQPVFKPISPVPPEIFIDAIDSANKEVIAVVEF